MIKRILLALNRRWPPVSAGPPALLGCNEDFSWHGSSFELARGLVVIEHCEAPPALSVDTGTARPRVQA